MITRSDWQAVLDEMNAEDRTTLGEPPTVEEARAYLRGELAPDEEERMRARLVAYPELLQALTAPFPAEEAGGGKVLQFWRASTALAAGLALVFGALRWRAGTQREPRVLGEEYVLAADGRRGPSRQPVTFEADGESIVLIVPLFDGGAHPRYRLELVDDQNRVLLRTSLLPRPANDAFRVEASLDKGRYRVILYGVNGTREQRIDTYSLRVR